jgi:uncharacterized damage-inducible protein DinB
MSRTFLVVSVALCAAAAPAAAQQHNPDHHPSVNAVATQKQLWMQATMSATRAAEQMPETDYAYRPVETVRSFGELVGHIAGAQAMMCAIALGETPPAEDAVEKSAKTKAALVAALKESTMKCEAAYAQADTAVAAPVTMFGMKTTRLFALGMNALHNGEHYGNMVTYMRMKGMVPPSSQGQ